MEDLKEKYLKKIDDITSKAKQDIEEVIKAYEEELNSQDGGHWIPAEEERYWWIDTEGYVDWTEWHGCTDDEGRLSIGNVFKTEKEAEFEVERLKILAIILKKKMKIGLYLLMKLKTLLPMMFGGIQTLVYQFLNLKWEHLGTDSPVKIFR
ncbi:hypothetical protein [Peptostreptococcus sp.]|uniref:hypothetical protein n=1 Tax=Peptostreptococcus sp. TaxID=1262 RepID=UPI00257FBDC7|nr:hypothetical protein [Peptostreptococcus sp.]